MSFAYAPALSTRRAKIVRGPSQHERRRQKRFPVIGQAQYSVAENQAQAPIRDISSGGVFLKIDRILCVGQRVRVFIDWPVLLENRYPLRLVIDGKVLRSDWAGTAVKLIKYDFKICPARVVHGTSA